MPRASVALLLLLAVAPARAEVRRLTLAEAVDLALRRDPVVAESRLAGDRAQLGLLRAQLDRVSVKVDGTLQELWNKTNIGGPTQYTCSLGVLSYSTTDPDACVGSGGTPTQKAEQSPSGGQGLFNVAATVNAPIFTGFRVTANVHRAERQRELASVAQRQARKDVALSVARAYWSIRRLALLQEVQRRALERLREAEALTGARVEAGVAPPIDRNRARLRRVQQSTTLADLAGQELEATAQLAVLLGLEGDVLLTDPIDVPDGPAPSVGDLLAEARRGRPEAETARLQLEAQRESVRIARAGYFPQLSAFGLLQLGNNPYVPGLGSRQASTSANPFGNLAGNLTFGAQLSMNFFDTLSTYTAVKDARLEESRLSLERQRWDRAIESDVRLAQARLARLQGRRAPLAEAAEVARDNVTILRARYQTGEALIIELLEAEVDLVSAELQLADLQAQMQLAWVDLRGALGAVAGLAR